MADSPSLTCRACNGGSFVIKYEATYEYSYIIDADAPGRKNTVEFLPFLYDRREQKSARQYLQCRSCGAKYPCYFNEWDPGRAIGVQILQQAIDAGAEPEPERAASERAGEYEPERLD